MRKELLLKKIKRIYWECLDPWTSSNRKVNETGAGWLPGPLPKQALLRWKQKLFQTGSEKDKPRTDRPQSRLTPYKRLTTQLASLQKVNIKLSAELGVPRITLRRRMKVDLKLFPHRSMFAQELSDDDLNRRRDACGRMFQNFVRC